MTELENNIPSVYIIIPLAGVPGFPQDTAAKKRFKKQTNKKRISMTSHQNWDEKKSKRTTSLIAHLLKHLKQVLLRKYVIGIFLK